MKAEKHFEVGADFEQQQADLDSATKWRAVLECCYMAAHHFLLAGAEWRGAAHTNAHAHSGNPGLLRQARAPAEVYAAWQDLDKLRPGRIYGWHGNGGASAEARAALKTIKEWAESVRP